MNIKKTSIYIALACLFAFLKLLFTSIYINLAGKNTRELTNKLAKKFGEEMLSAANATLVIKGQFPTLIPGRSYIIIGTHASHFDIPAIFAGIPLSIRMIAKKELFQIPLFGSSLRRHEYIEIDRQNRANAFEALEKAKALMGTGIVIWAAAEGTRSLTGELLPFKKGIFMLAIEAQAIVIPLVIQGSRDVLPAKTWHFSPDKTITMTVGNLIDTQNMTLDDRDALMADVRQQMETIIAEQTS